VVIAGNHDYLIAKLGRDQAALLLCNATYLENGWVDTGGLRVFGTPVSVQGSPLSPNLAFQSKACATAAIVAAAECGSADVLVSHGPNPMVATTLQPHAHIWGHYHIAYGVVRGGATTVNVGEKEPIESVRARLSDVNAGSSDHTKVSACVAVLDRQHHVRNLPLVIDLPRPPPRSAAASKL
jgi:hypothetical protein